LVKVAKEVPSLILSFTGYETSPVICEVNYLQIRFAINGMSWAIFKIFSPHVFKKILTLVHND